MISRRNVITSSLAGLVTQLHEAAADVDLDEQPKLDKLYELIKILSDALRDVRMTSPPIGSVQAFPGEWPPYRPDGERANELELGWLLCDGRPLDSVETALLEDWKKQPENTAKSAPEVAFLRDLRAALSLLVNGQPSTPIAVPDYRGYFLRGNDDGRGVDPGRQLGTEQDWATGLPKNGFKAKAAGAFDPANGAGQYLVRMTGGDTVHENTDDTGGEIDIRHGDRVRPVPDHEHSVAGGDSETRPRNASVKWIIKFR